MILGYHAVWTTYGTWLPNDPRGSYAEHVYNEELAKLGSIQYGRQCPQPSGEMLRRFWTAAVPHLKRRPFFLDDETREIVAVAFSEVASRLELHVYACAIMNDHVHIVLSRNGPKIEYIVGQFKAAGTKALGLVETPWARSCWKVFLNDTPAIAAATAYVEANPRKSGLRPQDWPFVTRLEQD